MKQFDFGKNWASFSKRALTAERIDQARNDFANLMQGIPLKNKTFLDIGFGQGLSLLIAEEHGAKVVGCDINPKCGEVLRRNRALFPNIDQNHEPPIVIGSILQDTTINELKNKQQAQKEGYDIVHSWGVLHHTGDMWGAIDKAISLIAPNGYLVLAIYNKHWSSPIWHLIKKSYCSSPKFLKSMFIISLYPVIMAAKAVVTKKNPFVMDRGMEFYHNVIDWVGGFPYEFTTIPETITFLNNKGFSSVKQIPAKVPTGCNEYVFKKIDA
jgi:2-polyprenyl-3-methyl-5-hydroxy-6-metoxy-1,4-benzoquinol methylase